MIAYRIEEAAAALRIGRTLFYREISEGRIRTVKIGRRTIVPFTELVRWIEANLGEDLAEAFAAAAPPITKKNTSVAAPKDSSVPASERKGVSAKPKTNPSRHSPSQIVSKK